MKTNATTTDRRRLGEKFQRVAALGLLALVAALFQASEANAQWTPPDAQGNISNTNTGNVGVGTTAPQFSFDVTGNDAPFRVRDKTGREYFSTGIRIGPVATWTTPVVSLAGGRLIVDSTSADGNNDTIVRRAVNNVFFYPSDHPDLPGNFVVKQKGGNNVLVIDQNTNGNVSINGNVGIGTGSPQFLLDVSGSAGKPFRVRDAAGFEYFATGTRTGPWGTTPVTSLSGGRLTVENNGPDGGNETIIRHLVNGIHFYPSEHPDYPGAFAVWQKGGAPGLVVNQNTNGNVGIGTAAPASKLHVVGDITVTGNINAKYQDVAEWVPTTEKLSAGTVVVVNAQGSNQVLASASAYDTGVAGVISAQPGLTLGEAGEGKALVATTGRVKVKVDATRAPIRAGDLLVTSDVPGVAMKSVPVSFGGIAMHRPGTIIGKALESLEKGAGEILVLLSLQ